MAKTKKDISEFQKAMLTNTKVIGNDNNKKNQAASRKRTLRSTAVDSELIPPEILEKYEMLAKKLGTTPEETIKLALNHFLELESIL